MIRRLIAVIDDSPVSERALPLALQYAERLGAEIELLGLAREQLGANDLRDHLDDLIRQCGPPVASSSVCVGDDDRAAEAHRLASDRDAAVVVGAQGHRLVDHDPTTLLIEQLIAEDVPVLVATPHVHAPAPELPVAACIDGSDESHRAIGAGARWARALGVPLVLVRVTQPDLVPPQVPAPMSTVTEDAVTDELAATIEQTSTRWPDLEVQGRVVEYRWAAADALALHFARHPAQLVAVATHPTTWWRRLVHAGVTAHLVDELPVPVVITLACAPRRGDERPPSADVALPTNGHPYDTVVLAVDPTHSPPPAAARTAVALARVGRARLSVVSCDGVSERELDRQRLTIDHIAGDVSVTWDVVHSSEVADAIVRAATRGAPSIVCLGTSPPGTLADILATTVTGATLRSSHDPVVLVGPRCDGVAARFAEVAACIDGSRASDAVVDLAATWAAAFAVPLRIIEVVEPSTTIPGAPGAPARLVDRLADRVARAHGITASSLVIESPDAAAAVRDWADDHPNSLLVMGSHGHGLAAHPLGRTVQSVVRHAPVPVAIVPRRLTAAA
ncbi:MAG: universal stress protein [Ilumatobacteraceae bacterium]